MKIISATKKELVLQFDERQRHTNSFIFEVELIADVPEARTVILRDPRNHARTWRISGKKFFHAEKLCIDDVVMLPKSMLRYRVTA